MTNQKLAFDQTIITFVSLLREVIQPDFYCASKLLSRMGEGVHVHYPGELRSSTVYYQVILIKDPCVSGSTAGNLILTDTGLEHAYDPQTEDRHLKNA